MFTFDCQPTHRDWSLHDCPDVSFIQDRTDHHLWKAIAYGGAHQTLAAGGFPGYHYSLPLKQLVGMVANILGCSPRLVRSAAGFGVQTSYAVGNTGFIVYKRPVDNNTWWYIKPVFPHRDRRVDDCQRMVECRVWNDTGQSWKTDNVGFATRAEAIAWLEEVFRDASVATYGGRNLSSLYKKYRKRWQLSYARRQLFGSPSA